jgi:AcrR family transcriptional regulator
MPPGRRTSPARLASGHGTFYLHYPDKRACFLAFVEDARTELDEHVRPRVKPGLSIEQTIAAMLNACSTMARRILAYSERQ